MLNYHSIGKVIKMSVSLDDVSTENKAAIFTDLLRDFGIVDSIAKSENSKEIFNIIDKCIAEKFLEK